MFLDLVGLLAITSWVKPFHTDEWRSATTENYQRGHFAETDRKPTATAWR